MSAVTSQQMIDAGPDDSSDSDFFNSSLSIWRGPRSVLEDFEQPVALDLHTACSLGNYDVVRNYINSEADLNAKNFGGYTPLMYAAYIGHDNIVNLLIEAQVDVNLANNKGLTPLMLAASCGNESICDFLKDAGAELEAKDKLGWTALFHATYNGHQNMVKFLIESGADMDAHESKYHYTPLMQAALQGHEIIVQCLLMHGANRHKTSKLGDKAQDLAMKKAYRKIVTLLESKAPAVPGLRSNSPYHSSGNSSDDNNSSVRMGTHRTKKLSIKDGPQALSKMMTPQNKTNVTFKEPVVTAAIPRKQRELVAPFSAEGNPRPGAGGLVVQTPGPSPKVVQVSPTPKLPPSGRPADVHELLVQLGLTKYEGIFIEQDIDLEVFLTLSEADLKEIGISTFGPRRKMTNAIASWHKENPTSQPLFVGGDNQGQLTTVVDQLQSEVKEKTWQLNQAYAQLEYYHKELEHEKNIRSLTENYLLAEKTRFNDIVKQCRETSSQCSKALKGQGKIKNISQLLRSRYEDDTSLGALPQQLQDVLSMTDEATVSQITALATSPTTELWDTLQQGLRDASTSTAMAKFNLDKLIKSTEAQ